MGFLIPRTPAVFATQLIGNDLFSKKTKCLHFFLESRKYKIKTRYENCMLNIELVHQKSAQEQIKTMNERSDEKGRKSID